MTKAGWLLFFLALATAWPLSLNADAVVQPPDEWLEESATNRRLWEEMRPTLLEWEFGEPQPYRLPAAEALAAIAAGFGAVRQDRATLQSEIGWRFDELDLNYDGVVDQFDVLELGYQVPPRKAASVASSRGANKVIVVRVEFSDYPADTEKWDYDFTHNLLLADGTGPNPSFHDYYEEVSYGDLDIQGTIDDEGPHDGWYTAPNTRNYYKVHIMELVQFAAQAVDEHTDFSEFDVDGDGYVDSLLIFYPYTEFSGGLWPHMSSGLNYYTDGVIVDVHYVSGFGGAFSDSFAMCCAAHEYGHILGLPDLYDIDGSSDGVGRWSMMAYNYDSNFKPPAFDAWCRQQLGWIAPLVVTEDTAALDLPQIATNRFALKLWTNGDPEEEYFLVENRQKTGTDATRPGAGLVIYHCDDACSNNATDTHRLVDVESADGLDGNGKDHLDYAGGSKGEPTDPFHADNVAAFNFTSNPPSTTYEDTDSYVRVEDISATAATMSADVFVETGTHPSVTITCPADGETVSGDVTCSADASAEAGRTITQVDFLANGYLAGSDTVGDGDSFEITWNSRTGYNTQIPLTAWATDSEGETFSDTISVTVSNSGEWPFSDDFSDSYNWVTSNPMGDAYWELKSEVFHSTPSCMGIGEGYDYNECDRVLSPLLDLTTAAEPTLAFYGRYRIPTSLHNLRVYAISEDGSTETLLKSYTGTELAWMSHAVYLDEFAGDKVFVAFELRSTGLSDSVDGGAWVDDVDLHERSAPPSIDSITPPDGTEVSGLVTIDIEASDDEEVTRVALWIDGEYQGSDTTEPFSFTWNSRSAFNGDTAVAARAYDRDEQYAEAAVTYVVGNSVFYPVYCGDFEDGGHFADWWVIKDASGPGIWQRTDYRRFRGGWAAYCGQLSAHQYGAYEYDWLVSPTIDLSGLTAPLLYFHHWWDTEANYDYAKVYVTTDLETWNLLGQYHGSSGGWQEAALTLGGYTGAVKLAFLLQSDPLVVGEGWYVDDVMVRPLPLVTGVEPSHASIGQQVTISGEALGDGYYPGALVLAGSGAVGAGNVVTWTDSGIVFTVPPATVSGDIQLWGQDTDRLLTIVLAPPELLSLSQY